MNTNDQYRPQQLQDRESNLAPAYRNGFNQERAWQAAREREYAQQQHFQAQASRQQQESAWEDFNPRGGYQERDYQSPQFGYGQVGIAPQQRYGQEYQGRNAEFAHNQYFDEYASQQQPRAQQPRPYPPYQPAYAGSQQGQHMQYGQASMPQQGYQGYQGYQGAGGQAGQSYQGQGPKNYTRSDERIREDVCERLTDSHSLNARDVDVQVKDGLATLSGTVASREMKREAEDLVHACGGVKDVQNNLRIQPQSSASTGTAASTGASGTQSSSTQSSMGSNAPRSTDRH